MPPKRKKAEPGPPVVVSLVSDDEDEQLVAPAEPASRHFTRSKSTTGKNCTPMLHYPSAKEDNIVVVTQADYDIIRDPRGLLNDTLIDFYIRYLLNERLTPEEKERCHIFSSFFYHRLSNSKQKIEERCRTLSKWREAKNLDVFQKDFIFFPVNEHLHWSLIVVCFPGSAPQKIKLPPEGTKKMETESQVPCILHLSSLKSRNPSIFNIIRSYIQFEWDRNKKDELGVRKIDKNAFPGMVAGVPQQNNEWDCGLYMLHFIELFSKTAPTLLQVRSDQDAAVSLLRSPCKFRMSEITKKRSQIEKLIAQLSNKRLATRPAAVLQICESGASASMDDGGVEVVGSGLDIKRLLNNENDNHYPDSATALAASSSSAVVNTNNKHDDNVVIDDGDDDDVRVMEINGEQNDGDVEVVTTCEMEEENEETAAQGNDDGGDNDSKRQEQEQEQETAKDENGHTATTTTTNDDNDDNGDNNNNGDDEASASNVENGKKKPKQTPKKKRRKSRNY